MFAALRTAARPSVRAFSTSRVAQRDIAKMTLVGRLGAMEVKEGKNGRQYLKYAIATTDRRPLAREGETPEEPTTSWHTVFANGDAVERLQNVQIGSLVFVEAAFQVRSQRDEDSGNYSTQILATHERMSVISKPKVREEAQQ
ncbi:hypothetical protein BMF94_1219 [Rhodotorula taiwanensis]|uniref:Uncharacterized protein n=1 Tax=Rhodotorula taiwanensis TaxID=741276 RepID=A0A2S5BFQ3_9BASI|nr:hypothetical protein BMF94_1219 [Rhodotorula taiwanensis]